MANLVYNIKRLLFLQRTAVIGLQNRPYSEGSERRPPKTATKAAQKCRGAEKTRL
jgi:hypothetical protein